MSEPSAKRFKKEKQEGVDAMNPDPSRVVHVRKLGNRASEADLLEALQTFGPISYITCMLTKRMALVEFENIDSARDCVNFSRNKPIMVAGEEALFNYSTSSMIQRVGLESEHPNHVLILTVMNAQYPVNVEIIGKICRAFGEVRRIAVLRRNAVQALVEFDSVESAKRAKQGLNGADIYSGCNTLKVEFARPDTVKITRNDGVDQIDYSQPIVPSAGGGDHRYGGNQGPPNGPYNGPVGGNFYPMERSGPLVQNFGGCPPQNGPPDRMGGGGGFDQYGGGGQYNNGASNYGPQGGNNYYGPPQGGGNYGPPGGGGGYGPPGPNYDPGPGGAYDQGFGGPPGRHGYGDASYVVMVYGVDHENWDCDKLFNLLCMYANVNKIKFMKSKPDTCMAELGNPDQVSAAIHFLHNCPVFNTKLALRPSKQQFLNDIRDPFELPSGAPSFKDYIGSRNQRFATPEAASRNRLVSPTNVLHFFNSPATMTEEKLNELFETAGAAKPRKVVVFPGRSERSSSGTVEFETTEQAVEAVIKANHVPIDSPVGKIPYIFKLAFAGGKDGRPF